MSIFRSCPSTNDLSESYIASAKYEKRRASMCDWSTIEATTIMRRNKTKDFFQQIKNDNEHIFNKAVDILSSFNERELIENHKKNKMEMKKTKALIVKEKIDKQKSLIRSQQERQERIMQTNLLSIDELNDRLKNIKSKNQKKELLKEQLKKYKLKYSKMNLEGFPKIQFSHNTKQLDEQQLFDMLCTCVDVVDKQNEIINQSENNASNNSSSNNNNHIGSKRMREYNINEPESKKPRIISLPNINFK